MKSAVGAEPVKVEEVQFGAGRMTLVVQLAAAFESTTPQLIARLCERYPELPHHACVNEVGPTFAAVMNHTSIAHLLEHLIITEQTRQTPPPSGSANVQEPLFCGATTWISREQRRARIEVSFADDLIALEALHNALAVLAAACC